MEQSTGRNSLAPNQSEKKFLNSLLWQGDNIALINFIASEFNSVPEKSLRQLKINDWIYAIDWMTKKTLYYDTRDFESFCLYHFNGTFLEAYFENLNKAREILTSLEDYDDIEMIGDKTFEEIDLITQEEDLALITKRYEKRDPANINQFFSYSEGERNLIISLYEEYLDRKDNADLYEDDTEENRRINLSLDARSEAVDAIIRKKISEELKTEENISIINRVCESFMRLSETTKIESISNSEIEHLISQEFSTENSLILTAYYLQYVLMSLGVSFPISTNYGIRKIGGKHVDLFQRLLCATTTQKWNRLNVKSNTYYKTVNNMFKFDKDIKEEKANVIKQLEKVKRELNKGEFVGAIKFLDEDIEKLKAYK